MIWVVLNRCLHTVLNVLSLNIIKRHCFPREKTLPNCQRFCGIVFLLFGEGFFKLSIAICVHISVFLGLKALYI